MSQKPSNELLTSDIYIYVSKQLTWIFIICIYRLNTNNTLSPSFHLCLCFSLSIPLLLWPSPYYVWWLHLATWLFARYADFKHFGIWIALLLWHFTMGCVISLWLQVSLLSIIPFFGFGIFLWVEFTLRWSSGYRLSSVMCEEDTVYSSPRFSLFYVAPSMHMLTSTLLSICC